jgi:hypothetical protein
MTRDKPESIVGTHIRIHVNHANDLLAFLVLPPQRPPYCHFNFASGIGGTGQSRDCPPFALGTARPMRG